MLPGLLAATRRSKQRQKPIRNGLPDALDLLIVCLEAGLEPRPGDREGERRARGRPSGARRRAAADTTEIRAGKPRLEAFKNFAERTRWTTSARSSRCCVQTDRFGTSVAQALRTHAETSRTKRRQRAEERAAKVGVKLVFPLVFFLFPAFYIVILGPAVIKFSHFFGGQIGQRLP